MQTDLITVTPETPLVQLHHLFLEEEINGAPVVDDLGNLVGLISSLDIIRVVQEEHDSGRIRGDYLRADLPYSSPDWFPMPEDFQDRLNELQVSDAMVREVITVTASTPIAQVAQVMREQRIHRVLVVKDRLLVGIITTFDLLRLIAEKSSP